MKIAISVLVALTAAALLVAMPDYLRSDYGRRILVCAVLGGASLMAGSIIADESAKVAKQ